MTDDVSANLNASKTDDHERASDGSMPASRRHFLMLLGASALLGGCAKATQRVAGLPSPAWDARSLPADRSIVATPTYSEPTPARPPREVYTPTNVLARSGWATGQPQGRLMKRMAPIRYITLHHDGMSPFYATDTRQVTARIDAIRRAHRGQGWGDIGYHFVVDRAGRVWSARPLNYQGAHVKHYNAGNIGVMALGSFDKQAPSDAQVAAVERHIGALMSQFNVPVSRVKTHREWSPTICPGKSLQAAFGTARSNGRLA